MGHLRPGSKVRWKERVWVIADFRDLETAELQPLTGKRHRLVPVEDLAPEHSVDQDRTLNEFSEVEWLGAQKLFETLKSLLDSANYDRSLADIDKAALALGKSRSTVYEYIGKYDKSKRISVFIRKQRSDKGGSRLPKKVQAIVDRVIGEFYLKEERPTPSATLEQIELDCRKAKVKPPSLKTLLRVISRLPPKTVTRGRHGKKAAREQHEPVKGSFPGADFPLKVVQIDHTPVDVIIVDEEERESINRAFLTIVIDVCTRVICGFCLSLEHPSSLTAALALHHAILPKNEWMRKHGLKPLWPVYGKPRKIYADNAKEFLGTALLRGCAEHNIDHANRPKGLPNYGGTVERAFRTFMKAAQRVRGTTFSNVVQKVKYNSAGKAILTLANLERWFGIYIAYRYHQRVHRGTGFPPIKHYERLVKGTPETPGIGRPEPIADPRQLLLDFLPFVTRVVSREGIVIDHIHYMNDRLRRWVNARDPEKPERLRKFICVTDPRDLSFIYFYDPELKKYIDVPYRDQTRPAISRWELEAATRKLKEDPDRQPNEDLVFQGIELLRKTEADAAAATTTARRRRKAVRTTTGSRRASERRKGWAESGETLRKPPKEGKRGTKQDDSDDSFTEFEIDES
ncbi:MAG: DDE-type integrase/transposase/recombinase [Rubrivivax sp.]|nr:DDE-type integrase/transposase/recombinase [Rubrivivax sp.]